MGVKNALATPTGADPTNVWLEEARNGVVHVVSLTLRYIVRNGGPLRRVNRRNAEFGQCFYGSVYPAAD
ncbi:hypothetical protein ROE7235_03774 [Roseibaca ekhonensis]|jgi:hypothetical protein|uniref:Uncharacterized protein n=2 Tax=Rhodobacterales TaxID=204455 RepID=A0A1H8IKR0_9RHOB|nr:hypothetical protein SAMN04488077_12431 [Roseovarius tolerans]SUZ33993.1 hypothetical protein ROE7235_03774 [Roseibaca ekhonensis]